MVGIERHGRYGKYRAVAWIALQESETKKELYNSIQRLLYHEAKCAGWRRSRAHGMRYVRSEINASNMKRDNLSPGDRDILDIVSNPITVGL